MTNKVDIPFTGRDVYFNGAGDDEWSGKSVQNSVTTPKKAIEIVSALVPIPSSTSPASINAAETGAYSAGLTIPDNVAASCRLASIVTTDAIALDMGNRQSSFWGAIVNLAAGGLCVKIDEKKRIALEINAFVVGDDVTNIDDGVGFQISGSCDDVFMQVRQCELRGARAVLIDHTAVSETPINYDFNIVEFFNQDQVVIRYNPAGTSSETIVSICAIQEGVNLIKSVTNSKAIDCKSGILVVRADVINAATCASIASGATLTVEVNVLSGNTVSSGVCIYKAVGLTQGNLETIGSGTIQITSKTVIGNATNAGDMSIISDSVVGDIVNNGTMFVNIGGHVGTVTNNGIINGIINGVRYGNWIVAAEDVTYDNTDSSLASINVKTAIDELSGDYDALDLIESEVLIDQGSLLTQQPTLTDTPLQIEFGAAVGSPSTDLQLSAAGALTVNKTASYTVNIIFQYGRAGAGGASILHLRELKNGTQIGRTLTAIIDTERTSIPLSHTYDFDGVEGDVHTFEIIRDSTGNNSGGLFSYDPTLAGITDSDSASLFIVEKHIVKVAILVALFVTLASIAYTHSASHPIGSLIMISGER